MDTLLMEPQAYGVLKRVFDLMSKSENLSTAERSYIIGTLETLIAMYTEVTDLHQVGDEEPGMLESLNPFKRKAQ